MDENMRFKPVSDYYLKLAEKIEVYFEKREFLSEEDQEVWLYKIKPCFHHKIGKVTLASYIGTMEIILHKLTGIKPDTPEEVKDYFYAT